MKSYNRRMLGIAVLFVLVTLSPGVVLAAKDSVGDGTNIPKIETVNFLLNEDQFVAIANHGNGSIDLTGWTLTNMANKTYSFPANLTLKPGYTIKVHSGKGNNTATNLYNSTLVWNLNGDTAILKDPSEKIVSEFTYPIKAA